VIVAWALLLAHAAAAVFGLVGMLVALRHPDLWVGTGAGEWLFSFGMRHGGVLQIALGAAAVLAFGGAAIGLRRTAIFCAVSTVCSLGAELLGTGTGWPFGAYTYGDALGPKIMERVPVGIPLSWFSLGLTSYALARLTFRRFDVRAGTAASIALAVWFFVVWDLVLDPAMASRALPIRFWTWHQGGPFFGMPLQNLAGWAATAALFMTISRWLWGDELAADRLPARFPVAMYAVNLGFAMALNASVGLWVPIVMALALGVGPAVVLTLPADRSACTAPRPVTVPPR
jgi:carotene biosynthesis associated membrane protein